MGEKRVGKKPHNEGNTVPTEGIVTSDQIFLSRQGRFYNAGKLLFVAGVVMLLGVGWGLWSINHSNKLPEPLVVAIDTDTHYDTADIKDIPGLLSLDYGMTIKAAASGRFTKRAQNYTALQNIAMSGYRLGNKQAELQAYSLAEHYLPLQDSYGFYRDYMIAAYSSGDDELGDFLHQKAIKYVQSTKDTEAEKASRIKMLEQQKTDLLSSKENG